MLVWPHTKRTICEMIENSPLPCTVIFSYGRYSYEPQIEKISNLTAIFNDAIAYFRERRENDAIGYDEPQSLGDSFDVQIQAKNYSRVFWTVHYNPIDH